MNHARDPELLSAYLDGELSPAERADVERWLADDAAARQLLEELRAVTGSIAELPKQRLPENLADRVLRQAERQMLAPPPAGDDRPQPAGSVWSQLAGRYLQRRSLVWLAVIVVVAIGLSIFDPARDNKQRQLAQAPPPAARGDAAAELRDRDLRSPKAEESRRTIPSISAMPASATPAASAPSPAAAPAPVAAPAAPPIKPMLAEAAQGKGPQSDVAERPASAAGAPGEAAPMSGQPVPAADRANLGLAKQQESENANSEWFNLAAKSDAQVADVPLDVVCVLSPQAAAGRTLETALMRNRVQRWGFSQAADERSSMASNAPREQQADEGRLGDKSGGLAGTMGGGMAADASAAPAPAASSAYKNKQRETLVRQLPEKAAAPAEAWELHAVMSPQQLVRTLEDLRRQPQQVLTLQFVNPAARSVVDAYGLSPAQMQDLLVEKGPSPRGAAEFDRVVRQRSESGATPVPRFTAPESSDENLARRNLANSRLGDGPDVAANALAKEPQQQLPGVLGQQNRLPVQLQTRALPRGADVGVERADRQGAGLDERSAATADKMNFGRPTQEAAAYRVRFLVRVATEPAVVGRSKSTAAESLRPADAAALSPVAKPIRAAEPAGPAPAATPATSGKPGN